MFWLLRSPHKSKVRTALRVARHPKRLYRLLHLPHALFWSGVVLVPNDPLISATPTDTAAVAPGSASGVWTTDTGPDTATTADTTTLTSSMVPQDFTQLSPFEWCSGPLNISMFGANFMNGWFCKDYVLGLLASGQGIVLHPELFYSGWFTDPFLVMKVYDDEVRDSMIEFHYDGSCQFMPKNFQACFEIMKPCNIIDVNVYESVPLCEQTCNLISRCTVEDCSANPPFDATNLTHCVPMALTLEASASIASFAAVLLMLIF